MNQTSLPPFDIGEHHLFVLTLKRIVQQARLILEWLGSVVPLIEAQGIFHQAIYTGFIYEIRN